MEAHMTKKLLTGATIAMVVSTLGPANLLASQKLKMEWPDLCALAHNDELVVTVASGNTVRGTCESVDNDSLSLNSYGRVLTVDRSVVSRIHMLRKDRRRLLPILGDQVGWLLVGGAYTLFSPYAPVGVLFLSAAAVYGAAGAPVCAVADLAHRLFHDKTTFEIILI
jgi:hypothetical protein